MRKNPLQPGNELFPPCLILQISLRFHPLSAAIKEPSRLGQFRVMVEVFESPSFYALILAGVTYFLNFTFRTILRSRSMDFLTLPWRHTPRVYFHWTRMEQFSQRSNLELIPVCLMDLLVVSLDRSSLSTLNQILGTFKSH